MLPADHQQTAGEPADAKHVYAEATFGACLAGDLGPAIRAARADAMYRALAEVAALLANYLADSEGQEPGMPAAQAAAARMLLEETGCDLAAAASRNLAAFAASTDRALSRLGRRELRRRLRSLAGRIWELACAADDQASDVIPVMVLQTMLQQLCPGSSPPAFRRLTALLADPGIPVGPDLAGCTAQVRSATAIGTAEFTFTSHDLQAGRMPNTCASDARGCLALLVSRNSGAFLRNVGSA
jgi:hypothetical protein